MGKILNKLKQLFIGKPIVFYVSLLIDLVMFTLYSHITYKVNMVIYKYSDSAWPYFVDFVFAALLIDRVYRIYVNFKKHYDVVNNDDDVLKQKRKELLKMRKSLEAATALVQKLRRDKIKYQEKIEARLQENPDAEDAKIDVFLSEIDRLDSRIAIGESTRENFESKVNILIRECNALEIMPEPEVENHIEEPNNDEVEEELNYYNQQLTTLRAQRVDLLRILERVRGNIPANDPTLERAEALLLRLEEQIRATQTHANYYHQIRVANNIEYINRVLMQETRRVVEGDREETEDNEQEYPLRDDVEIEDLISTDGYPICPHCQREHNYEGGHEHTPYCSQDCKNLDNTCGICLKPLTDENNHGGYCSFYCVTESHNRAGNGD